MRGPLDWVHGTGTRPRSRLHAHGLSRRGRNHCAAPLADRRRAVDLHACCGGLVHGDARAAHARRRQHPEGQVRASQRRTHGRRQGTRRVQAREPRVGEAGRHFAQRAERADRHRGPQVLRAQGTGLQAHHQRCMAHLEGRPAGRLDHHPAAGTQSLSARDRPRADHRTQDQGGADGAEDRVGL
jgi:hypothetical protein